MFIDITKPVTSLFFLFLLEDTKPLHLPTVHCWGISLTLGFPQNHLEDLWALYPPAVTHGFIYFCKKCFFFSTGIQFQLIQLHQENAFKTKNNSTTLTTVNQSVMPHFPVSTKVRLFVFNQLIAPTLVCIWSKTFAASDPLGSDSSSVSQIASSSWNAGFLSWCLSVPRLLLWSWAAWSSELRNTKKWKKQSENVGISRSQKLSKW